MLIRPPDHISRDYGAIEKRMMADYNANQSLWQIFWTEGTLDTRLEAGDTSLMADINGSMPNNNRGQWYFNRVRPLCNMVSGYQRRNRRSTIIVPLENGDDETADQWTKILLHIYKREQVYEHISDAFHQGACITGMNLLHVYLDFRNDPLNGDVKIDNLPYNSFFIDPYFRKTDLSDCAFVWRRSYLSHSAAASLIPDKYDDIMATPGNPTGTGRDGRFQYMPESYGQTQQNRVAYDEYYYRDYRKQRLLIDKRTGDVQDISLQDELDIETFLSHYPETSVIEQQVPTVRLAIAIQDKVFWDGPSGLDRYPFVPVVGYYNPMMPYFYSRIQGIARSLRDPQMLLNRRIVLSADLLESQVNSGWIFKENAPVDVKHLFQTGQGRVIPLKEEAQMTDIQPIIPPQIPPSFFQLQETFSKELNMVSGINEELMGSAIDDKAGILSALRQGAGLTTLQPLFDKLDFAQKMLGEIIMDVIRVNYTPGKIKNILSGQEPTPFFYKKSFGKYHCMVEAGFDTESQKQMEFLQLIQLRELGIEIPPKTLIEAATLQNKKLLIQDIEQGQQAQMQQMQQMQQAQVQETQARTELAQARAIADKGLGVERMSRVQENQALAMERQAQARKDDEESLLNKVKLLKEIEGLDVAHLERLVTLAHMVSTSTVTKSEEGAQPSSM